jgi:hypothetical protein
MDEKIVIEKKPYSPPELIEYGDLAEITGSSPNPGPGDPFPGSRISG